MQVLNKTQQESVISLLSPIIDAIVDKVAERVIKSTIKQEPRYYTRQETADMLHITLPTLHRLTKDNIISCRRIGGRILYDAESIDCAVKEKIVFKYKRIEK